MLEWAGVLDRFQALSAQVRLQRWGGDCYAFALVAMIFGPRPVRFV